MEAVPAKTRKREALSALRDLAGNLGLQPSRRKVDLPEVEFVSFHKRVVDACQSPEQRRLAECLLKNFRGNDLPALPPLPGSAPVDAEEAVTEATSSGEFRLRGLSCLIIVAGATIQMCRRRCLRPNSGNRCSRHRPSHVQASVPAPKHWKSL